MGTYKLSFGERGNQPKKTTMKKMVQLCLLVMIIYALCLGCIASKCHVGYKSLDGDIRGIGMLGHFRASNEDCANSCNRNLGCCSYEHSEEKGKCNLNIECRPNARKWRDQSFCAADPKCQDGFKLTPGDIRGIGNLGHLITTYKVCADLCSCNHQCCSYEYSQEKGKCNLNKGCYPNRPQWRDQIFCAKRRDPR